jgi:Protein of unknown function (DUF2569)
MTADLSNDEKIIVNVSLAVLLGGVLVQAILFYRKSRYFPRALIIISALSCVVVFIGVQINGLVALVPTIIWIPYMLISERVKETFVR